MFQCALVRSVGVLIGLLLHRHQLEGVPRKDIDNREQWYDVLLVVDAIRHQKAWRDGSCLENPVQGTHLDLCSLPLTAREWHTLTLPPMFIVPRAHRLRDLFWYLVSILGRNSYYVVSCEFPYLNPKESALKQRSLKS